MQSSEYGDRVLAMTDIEFEAELRRPDRLLFSRFRHGSGQLGIQGAWAPFDHVNTSARVAIIGITPGMEQMQVALRRYRREGLAGQSHSKAGRIAKGEAAFTGPIRDTLVRCLDEVGLNRYLGIQTCRSLWGAEARAVHFSSALRWPIFIEGKGAQEGRMVNYSGRSPDPLRVPEFVRILESVLVPEIRSLPEDALIVPLGDSSRTMVQYALGKIPDFDWKRFIPWIPHPSGGNRDISSQFLGDPPSPGRVKPLNPTYRQQALALRSQIDGMAKEPIPDGPSP